jgi:hypothetical protein
MGKNAQFFMVVAGILVLLLALYLGFGHLKHEREEAFVLNPGDDEQSQVLRREADEFRIANRNQQRGIVVVASVIVVLSAVWWAVQPKREPE